MSSLPWFGLAFLGAASVAGLAVAAVRALAAYRSLRSFRRRLARTTGELFRLLDGIEPRVAKASATAARRAEARVRLQESTETASVLFGAFGEVLALLRRANAFVPR
jgi:hypothetical protein